MVRSLALGLVLATGALVGRLPPGEGQAVAHGQTPPLLVAHVQPPTTGAPSVVSPSKKAPFENLFQNLPKNPPDPDVAAALVEQLAAKTKVVCGLTMLQVDPTTDPKIRRDVSPAPAQNPNLTRQPYFKIRRITPAMCRE
jgi:hypothetical protein